MPVVYCDQLSICPTVKAHLGLFDLLRAVSLSVEELPEAEVRSVSA